MSADVERRLRSQVHMRSASGRPQRQRCGSEGHGVRRPVNVDHSPRAFSAAEIAALVDDLARNAEAVCRCYLSRGRRQGGYWTVGDLGNNPGRSLHVRLKASSKGAAGKFTDEATGEHGDLLDIIRETQGLRTFAQVVAEARRFLGLPDHGCPSRAERSGAGRRTANAVARRGPSPVDPPESSSTVEAARRLFAGSRPIAGTLAELYLRRRGITPLADIGALRFQPRCFYRLDEDDDLRDPPEVSDDAAGEATRSRPPHRFLPALIAAVTDNAGAITGVQRTYLDAGALVSDAPVGPLLGKAPVPSPRRALGDLLGAGVRFGPAGDIAAAGEGVETMLSLRMALPGLPTIAALPAGHLGALLLPPTLRRLYIAQDADPAGRAASTRLVARAEAAGIEAIILAALGDDLNGDLRRFGVDALRHHLRPQLAPEDIVRFLAPTG